jgi:AcrR family transcriptional regulator
MQQQKRAARSVVSSKRRAYHHNDLPEALTAAALQVITDRASVDISLREIARAIGVSHAAAYRHFATKTALLAAVATRGMWRLAAWMQRIERLPAATTPGDKVCALGSGYVRFGFAHPGYHRAMFAPAVARKADFPELRDASDAASEPLVRAVEACMAAGLLHGETNRCVEHSLAIWSLVHGIVTLALDGQFDEGVLRLGPGDRIAVRRSASAYEALAWRAVDQYVS